MTHSPPDEQRDAPGHGTQDSAPAADRVLKLVGSCAEKLLDAVGNAPRVAVVLGSGFQTLASTVEVEGEIAFEDLPGFPKLGVPGHRGRLLWGRFGSMRAFFCLGRAHYYEGHSMERVTWPVRVLATCGVERLILTNAAGAINPTYKVGDFMLFSDHINFIGVNPLRGMSSLDNRRFLDLNEMYSPRLRASFRAAAKKSGAVLHEGVYLGVSGPTYETPAEIRAFRALGGDAVGMSTIPEAIMGKYSGMEVAALSCITNPAAGMSKEDLSHQHVLNAGREASGKARDLFLNFAAQEK